MSSLIQTHLDVSYYVALGDSLTAGYADGALYYDAQHNSYAAILARQLKYIGAGNFKQPLMDPHSVGVDLSNNSRLALKFADGALAEKNPSLTFLAPHGDHGALQKNLYALQGPFNNMGVPGAKVTSMLFPGYGNPANGPGNYNPFFTRMASDPASASILSDALALNPSFFSLFIGNNDALAYALKGGTEDGITPLTGTRGIGFGESLKAIVDALTARGAKGVIATIPDLVSVPFFTTLHFDDLLLTREKAEFLNSHYASAGLHFTEGRNTFPVSDSATNSVVIRPMKKGELVLYDLLLDKDRSLFLQGLAPIPKKYFLSAFEIARVQNAITEYNIEIVSIAGTKKLALVDVNSLLKGEKSDRHYNFFSQTVNYKKKGAFSLDGLHPTPFGNALLANEFIKAINATYGTAIPCVKILRYKGITFPPNKT